MARDHEGELEALRQFLDRNLEELRRQIRGENYDHFLINLTQLESTMGQALSAAEARFNKSMEQVAQMRVRNSSAKVIEVSERMAAEALARDQALIKRILEAYVRDCAPPGFRIVE